MPNTSIVPPKSRILKEFGSHPVHNESRKSFAEAEQIMAFLNAFGLGDSVMEFRIVIAMAQKHPQKRFYVYLPKGLAEVPYLDYPGNVAVVGEMDEIQLRKTISGKKTMILTLNGELSVESALTILKQRHRFSEDRFLEKDRGRVSHVSARVLLSHIPETSRLDSKAGSNRNTTINTFDLKSVVALRILGIHIEKNDLSEPFLKINQEVLSNHPVKFDMLLAPDAAEITAPMDTHRSAKSISVGKWGEIFSRFPRDKSFRLGIVLGKSHPDYCQKVYLKAREYGIQVELVDTPTLTDFCHVVLSCKRFVGMDSGTTHLASEVVKAAEKSGRTIDIREVFNGNVFIDQDYAIRGHGTSENVLYFRSNFKMKVPSYVSGYLQAAYINDLDHISANDVVNFLFDNQKGHTKIRNFILRLLRRDLSHKYK